MEAVRQGRNVAQVKPLEATGAHSVVKASREDMLSGKAKAGNIVPIASRQTKDGTYSASPAILLSYSKAEVGNGQSVLVARVLWSCEA